jgi:hypothetical protein
MISLKQRYSHFGTNPYLEPEAIQIYKENPAFLRVSMRMASSGLIKVMECKKRSKP